MNIFKVVDSRSGKTVDRGFESKMKAKKVRDEKNKKTGKMYFIINRDTDHLHGISVQFKGKKKFK